MAGDEVCLMASESLVAAEACSEGSTRLADICTPGHSRSVHYPRRRGLKYAAKAVMGTLRHMRAKAATSQDTDELRPSTSGRTDYLREEVNACLQHSHPLAKDPAVKQHQRIRRTVRRVLKQLIHMSRAVLGRVSPQVSIQ